MGIIDDYYGGYENLAFFTDEDGNVDFEAAYESQLPDDDGYFDDTLEPWERGLEYKFKQVLKEFTLPGWTDTRRKTRSGQPIYEGSCSSCGKHTTVPFIPMADGSPTMCRECRSNCKTSRSGRKGRSGSKAVAAVGGNGSNSNRESGAGSSREAGQDLKSDQKQVDA